MNELHPQRARRGDIRVRSSSPARPLSAPSIREAMTELSLTKLRKSVDVGGADIGSTNLPHPGL
jgi:hypothetical protein